MKNKYLAIQNLDAFSALSICKIDRALMDIVRGIYIDTPYNMVAQATRSANSFVYIFLDIYEY
jgi:hypothetical protein